MNLEQIRYAIENGKPEEILTITFLNKVRQAILDAEDDGGAVAFPRYRAIGFDAETNCAEMVADEEGAWVHVMDIPYARPAQPGVVSDEAVLQVCMDYYGEPAWKFMSHKAGCLGRMRAALTHFAKGERHE